MKRYRSVSIYYRNNQKVFKKIPNVLVFVDEKKNIPERVYTLPPLKHPQELDLISLDDRFTVKT